MDSENRPPAAETGNRRRRRGRVNSDALASGEPSIKGGRSGGRRNNFGLPKAPGNETLDHSQFGQITPEEQAAAIERERQRREANQEKAKTLKERLAGPIPLFDKIIKDEQNDEATKEARIAAGQIESGNNNPSNESLRAAGLPENAKKIDPQVEIVKKWIEERKKRVTVEVNEKKGKSLGDLYSTITADDKDKKEPGFLKKYMVPFLFNFYKGFTGQIESDWQRRQLEQKKREEEEKKRIEELRKKGIADDEGDKKAA